MSELIWTVDAFAPKIEAFLNPILDAGDFDIDYDIFEVEKLEQPIGPEIAVDFEGADTELLLRRRAELLLALEHLTLEALQVPHQDRHRLMFDVDEYRMLRIDELCQTAKAAAEQVVRTGKRFEFSPMTSRERRIVHIVVSEFDSLITASEGVPPHRYAVIETRESGSA